MLLLLQPLLALRLALLLLCRQLLRLLRDCRRIRCKHMMLGPMLYEHAHSRRPARRVLQTHQVLPLVLLT
jgi:hypothetical protein